MFFHSSKHSIVFTFPLLCIMIYLLYAHIQNPLYFGFLDRLDLAIHEMGHIVFRIFGNNFLSILGGTLMQILIPLLMMMQFSFQKEFFGVALCFGWLGENFFYISQYSGDAVKLQLPLLNMWGSGSVVHDWHYIFSHLGVLSYTDQISYYFWLSGVICFLICFLYSVFLIVQRWREHGNFLS